jgi:hypothetical protein
MPWCPGRRRAGARGRDPRRRSWQAGSGLRPLSDRRDNPPRARRCVASCTSAPAQGPARGLVRGVEEALAPVGDPRALSTKPFSISSISTRLRLCLVILRMSRSSAMASPAGGRRSGGRGGGRGRTRNPTGCGRVAHEVAVGEEEQLDQIVGRHLLEDRLAGLPALDQGLIHVSSPIRYFMSVMLTYLSRLLLVKPSRRKEMALSRGPGRNLFQEGDARRRVGNPWSLRLISASPSISSTAGLVRRRHGAVGRRQAHVLIHGCTTASTCSRASAPMGARVFKSSEHSERLKKSAEYPGFRDSLQRGRDRRGQAPGAGKERADGRLPAPGGLARLGDDGRSPPSTTRSTSPSRPGVAELLSTRPRR